MSIARVAAAGAVTTATVASVGARNVVTDGCSSSSRGVAVRGWSSSRVVGVRASNNDVSTKTVTGVVFEPFSEVQDQLVKVTTSPQLDSLARQRFSPSCEAAINEQIK